MVEQTVEDGRCQDLIPEQVGPLREGLVTGDDQAAAFIPPADQLEEVVGLDPIEPEVADLIDDQYGRFQVRLELVLSWIAVIGGLELLHQGIQRGAVEGEPPLARGDGQGYRHMRLPGARGAEEDRIGLLFDKAPRGQLLDPDHLERRLEGEVEAVEGCMVGQSRQLEHLCEPASFADTHLFLEDQVQELAIAHLALLGPGDEGIHRVGEVTRRRAARVGYLSTERGVP